MESKINMLSVHTLFFISLLQIAQVAYGLEARYCDGKSHIIHMDRPVQNGNLNSFKYSFEIICNDPSWPTVIEIPGGPGQTTIGKKGPTAKINVIHTDPRGTGENANYWLDGGSSITLNSESVADDIVAVVKKLNLTDYAIHGVSYGTLVASVFDSKIQKTSLSKPNAVLIEGIFGKAFEDGEQLNTLKKKLNKKRSQLLEAGICLDCMLGDFKSRYESVFNRTVNAEDLGQLISYLIAISQKSSHLGAQDGVSLDPRDTKYSTMSNLIPNKNEDQFKTLFNSLGSKEFYQVIACNEVTRNGATKEFYDLKEGALTGELEGTCGLNNKLTNPYDSRKYQGKSKTFYLQGEDDPWTPLEQAQYHFKNQKNSDKIFLCFKEAGHNPLQAEVDFCKDYLFEKMARGESINSSDLVKCSRTVSMRLDCN